MARLVRACLLLSLRPCLGAILDDEAVLAQARVHLHQDPAASSALDIEPRELMAQIKARMEDANRKKNVATSGKAAPGSSVGFAETNSEQEAEVDLFHGVKFQREIVMEDESKVTLEIDRGCGSSDKFGSDGCVLHANERLRVKLSYRLGKPVDEGTTLTVNMSAKVRASPSIGNAVLGQPTATQTQTTYNNLGGTCTLCGRKCTMGVMGHTVSFAMPPCPLPAGDEKTLFEGLFKVPSTNGIKISRAVVSGSVNVQRPDGSTLLKGTGSAVVGELKEPPCSAVARGLGFCGQI